MNCSQKYLFCTVSEWNFIFKFPETCYGGVKHVYRKPAFKNGLFVLFQGGGEE